MEKALTKKEQESLNRVKVDNRLLNQLKRILKDVPVTEVTGKLDLINARCCRKGTYAIVKIDRDAVKKKA